MFNLRNISIKVKLVLMQVLISFIVLGVFFTVFVLTDIKGYKERKQRSMSTIAQVISSSSISALQFADNTSAAGILSELKVQGDIQNAAIVDKRGKLFASYNRQGKDSASFTPHLVLTDQ